MPTNDPIFNNIIGNDHKPQTPAVTPNEKIVLQNEVNINDIYTEDEQRNVNNIFVTIPDQQTPVVIFFGSPSSGKTVALLRMHKWLTQQGYSVFAEPNFRPRTDRHYARMCSELPSLANAPYTPGATDIISFMLVKVVSPNNRTCCQILEAPGEHYFRTDNPNAPFPLYIQSIVNLPNRKVWVFFVEQDWGDNQLCRDQYAQKICDMQGIMNPQDKVVFLFNKCDIQRNTGQYRNNRPIADAFFNNIKNNYPHIFDRYQRKGFERFLFGEFNCSFVCFSAGTFVPSGVFDEQGRERESWVRGGNDDWYCKQLWDALRR